MFCKKYDFQGEGRFYRERSSSLADTNQAKHGKASWPQDCPICKRSRLKEGTEKRMFGLLTVKSLSCDSCGAVFIQDKRGYKLFKIKDSSLPVWQSYGNQSLTEKEWQKIGQGGMSDAKQKEADMEIWLRELKEGNIPISLEGSQAPIILKKGEALKVSLPNIVLWEPRAVRRTKGGYGGPSIRVAKGLYFRVGQFSATGESHDEMRSIDQGNFSLTNKRIIFSGSKRAIEVPLKKIISMEPFSDGIAIRRSNKAKTETFAGINQAKLTILVDERSYEETLSGLILMYLIEGLIKKEE